MKMNMNNTHLYQASLEYLREGFSVIPLDGTKRPLVLWKPYQQRLATESELQEWFSSYQLLGIGIVTGKVSNLVVIDIDPRHGGHNHKLSTTDTPTSLTGSGGWHYYFFPNDDSDLQSFALTGYDFQANGHYVVAPPSLHPNGNTYQWLKPLRRHALQAFPQWYKQQHIKEVAQTNTKKIIPVTQHLGSKSLVSHALIQAIHQIPLVEIITGEGFSTARTSDHSYCLNCPFHDDRTPSCYVFTDNNILHCFGSGCDAHWLDAIAIVRRLHNMSFIQACNYLKQKYLGGIHAR